MIKITITEPDGRKTEVEVPIPGEVVVRPIKRKEDFVNEEAEKMGLDIVKAPKPIAELEDEDEPEEPKKGKRRPIDDGKILALRKAGLSLQKIADEMHLSYATVSNHLKNMEEAADEKVM